MNETAAVGLPVAVVAKHRAVSFAENNGGGIVAGVAEKEAGVLGEELVSRVYFKVAVEAELGGVGAAVEEGSAVAAVVAERRSGGMVVGHSIEARVVQG